ncbi:MAG: transglutaminase-like domain-containing protein [Oscillospiraceae bacterium]|nr:transglutaminase-like domain-containing protein [Oscillospiraceae bacterium]
MIFSQHMIETAQVGFQTRLEQAGAVKGGELRVQLDQAAKSVSEDVLAAVQWLYANSPLSDLANNDFELFLSGALHGVFLREYSSFAKDLPEDIFLNYVLHIRVNEEELCDCRRFFWNLLWERVRELSARDAVIEVNYWNAEQLTYQATDSRTISALGAYRSGYGRCGEESAFGVNAFRSVGIPARQIYTPRWAHCDDNHAWVEVWCDGRWHFLGACEPEEVLDKGWFTNASSRAMLIHSRCFGEISGEDIISKIGMASFLNNLKLYAVTRRLTVAVKDSANVPVEGAQVSFGILNYSSILPSAVMTTGPDGLVCLTCGLGSINVHVKKDGVSCERMVYVPDQNMVEVVLKQDTPELDVWEDFAFIAPKDQIIHGAKPTEEQKELCRKKTAAANEQREQRVAAMFDAARVKAAVEKYGYSQEIYNLLYESRGNGQRLLDFLEDETFSSAEKEKLLLTLSAKDWLDADPEVLREALSLSLEYAVENEDLFYRYIVCPRIFNEPLEKNRKFILEYFTQEQKEAFAAEPQKIWDYIQENIGFDSTIEYGQIITRPIGALTVKNANPLSKKILFVAICRAVGVAARVNPVDRQAEYYMADGFVPLEPREQGSGAIIFEKADGENWQYYPDFSIGLLVDGEYQTLDLSQEKWEGNVLRTAAKGGDYRVITDNRLPNGNLYASKYHFRLADGEIKRVRLRKYQANLTEMLDNFTLDEFWVFDEQGTAVPGSELTKNSAILLWLEEGAEPTEHILNEMLEQKEDFQYLSPDIIFLVRGKEALRNAKVKKVLEALPKIRVFYDSFVPNVETLARRMYVDHEKLPLILITTKKLNAVYACSGYHVGSGSMIVKICNLA